MDDLLMSEPAKPKKKKSKKKRGGLNGLDDAVAAKHHLVHVNVNVVNKSDSGHGKKSNPADDALERLRGY